MALSAVLTGGNSSFANIEKHQTRRCSWVGVSPMQRIESFNCCQMQHSTLAGVGLADHVSVVKQAWPELQYDAAPLEFFKLVRTCRIILEQH